jgi:NhaP-type Na+/H+ or K+/H+ antiporter
MLMAMTELGLDPVAAVARIGVLGVGAQWIAWRMQIPAIVLMLLAGILVGPVLVVLNPAQDLGPIMTLMISIAVAVILFEGGLSLNIHNLRDATQGVVRLVVVGAPLGWILSTLALHYGAGLGWESSAVFGGIMIVTGQTVIAPLLRQAKLSRRPAALLQWEAIVNEPIGALAAVLAFEYVLVSRLVGTVEHAMLVLVSGIALATVLGVLSGWGIATAFRR